MGITWNQSRPALGFPERTVRLTQEMSPLPHVTPLVWWASFVSSELGMLAQSSLFTRERAVVLVPV